MGKVIFLSGEIVLEDFVCNTLKFERVLFDYNDQCHGW